MFTKKDNSAMISEIYNINHVVDTYENDLNIEKVEWPNDWCIALIEDRSNMCNTDDSLMYNKIW